METTHGEDGSRLWAEARQQAELAATVHESVASSLRRSAERHLESAIVFEWNDRPRQAERARAVAADHTHRAERALKRAAEWRRSFSVDQA